MRRSSCWLCIHDKFGYFTEIINSSVILPNFHKIFYSSIYFYYICKKILIHQGYTVVKGEPPGQWAMSVKHRHEVSSTSSPTISSQKIIIIFFRDNFGRFKKSLYFYIMKIRFTTVRFWHTPTQQPTQFSEGQEGSYMDINVG